MHFELFSIMFIVLLKESISCLYYRSISWIKEKYIMYTYRCRVKEEQNKDYYHDKNNESNDVPLIVAPKNVSKRLERICYPEK